MKGKLLPLDERPCNRVFPQMIARTNKDLELEVPTLEMLGSKRIPADPEDINRFLLNEVEDFEFVVISLDMLLYGGLIPSRLHHLDHAEAVRRFDVLRKMRMAKPALKIYAFQCIMRAPSYDSSEEEPEYYADWGYLLFRRKYLMDLGEREGLSDGEAAELASIEIPDEVICDYERRRAFNESMNIEALRLLDDGTIDFLVIPQDDSAPYGYTAISQKRVISELKRHELDMRCMVYPGADEVSMSLLARAYNEAVGYSPRVWPFFASVLGPQIIPLYEDRPMMESLKSHVRVTGARLADSPQEADLLLAINCPGKVMQESFVPESEKDLSYTSYRQLFDFTHRIAEYLAEGRRVALCDSAFANGGDVQCIRYLDRLGALQGLCAYAGWNTNCNTLGTVLAQALVGTNQDEIVRNTCYRIIEDVYYQALVRPRVVAEELPSLGLGYYDFADREELVADIIRADLQGRFDELGLARSCPTHIERVYMPWHRMFEIGMEIEGVA